MKELSLMNINEHKKRPLDCIKYLLPTHFCLRLPGLLKRQNNLFKSSTTFGATFLKLQYSKAYILRTKLTSRKSITGFRLSRRNKTGRIHLNEIEAKDNLLLHPRRHKMRVINTQIAKSTQHLYHNTS